MEIGYVPLMCLVRDASMISPDLHAQYDGPLGGCDALASGLSHMSVKAVFTVSGTK